MRHPEPLGAHLEPEQLPVDWIASNMLWSVMQGSVGEQIAQFFVGGAPRLRVEEVIYSPGDRYRLQTVSGGVVHLQLGE